ncbi:MAG: hypothetical protein FWG71_07850 [Synergistaceae bacterium]|nr:hypothetical protein [Synergistaceae bacterium]
MKSYRMFIAAMGIAALCAMLPPSAWAADDPMGGYRDAYVKDSILTFFIPSNGGTNVQSRVVSFDAKEPGNPVGRQNAHLKNGADFNLNYGANVTGIPAALGRFRGEDGKLAYAIADYGATPNLWIGKVGLDGVVDTPARNTLATYNGSFSRATDLLMHDVNGDGVEDFIVAEIFYYGSGTGDRKEIVINIIDGKTKSSHRHTVAGTIYAETPFLKLGLADLQGNGKKQLAAAYSNFAKDQGQGFYYFDLYDIDSPSLSLTRVHQEQICDNERDTELLALAVGKFSGSGRDEVMVLSNYNKPNSSDNEYNFWLYYYNGVFNHTSKRRDPGGYSRDKFDGAVAYAYDLDADGKDEFIWAAPAASLYMYIGVAKVDSGYNINADYVHNVEQSDKINYSQPMVTDMAVGSFSGRTRAGNSGKAQGEVVVFRRLQAGTASHLTVYDPVLDGNGAFKELAKRDDGSDVYLSGGPYMPVMTKGNILGQSLRFTLEPPEVIDMGEELLITSVIPMPPKHVDYIPIPYNMGSGEWVLPGGQSADILYGTMYEDFHTSLSRSQSSANAITSTQKTSGGYTAGFHANVNTMLQLDFAANVAQEFMNKNTTIDTASKGLSMTDQSKFRDNVSYTKIKREIWKYKVVGERVKDPETGAWEEVYYEFEKPVDTFKVGTASDNVGADFAEIYAPIHERYNVLSYPSNVAGTLDFPIEPERILSPVMTIEDVATAANKKWDITWGKSFTDENATGMSINADVTASIGVAFGSSAASEKKGVRALIEKAASVNRQNAKAILEGKFGGKYSWETGSVTSSKWDDSVIVSTFANTERQAKHPARLNYMVDQQIFKLPNGAVSVANAVRLPKDTGRPVTIWDNPNSVYMLKPDLALNLPYKFQTVGVDVMNEYLGVEPTAEPLDALAMRGLRVLNKSDSPYAGADPLMIPTDEDIEGTKIRFPVYNYSTGVNAPDFEVRVRLIPLEETRFLQMPDWTGPNKGPAVVYDKTFTVGGSIPYHQPDKNNWVWVEHTFTDEIKRLPEGEYRLFIELDPNNKIDETHKKWDYRVENLDPGSSSIEPYAYNPGGDPGGNNIGFVVVALYNYFDDAYAAPARLSRGGTVTADADDPIGIHVKIVDNDLRPELTRSAIINTLARGETIPYELDIWYDDPDEPDFVPGFRIALTIVSDKDGSERMIGYKAIPGFAKGRVYKAKGVLDEEALNFILELRKGRLEAQVLGSQYNFVLDLPQPVAFDHDGGGSGSGCAAGPFSVSALLLLAAAFVRGCVRNKKIAE